MEEYFEGIVAEDSVEAWAALKDSMPWSWAPSDQQKKLFKQLDLQDVEIDTEDPEEITALLQSSQDGTIFGEFWFEPSIEIGGDFYPYILTCQILVPLSKESTPNHDLTNLYRSSTPIASEDFSPISLLVIVCPRCQLRFTEGDPDFEVGPEECRFEDCIACGGTGEWHYELEA